MQTCDFSIEGLCSLSSGLCIKAPVLVRQVEDVRCDRVGGGHIHQVHPAAVAPALLFCQGGLQWCLHRNVQSVGSTETQLCCTTQQEKQLVAAVIASVLIKVLNKEWGWLLLHIWNCEAAVLSYAMCYASLDFAGLCYALLVYVVLCQAVLGYAMLGFAGLCYAICHLISHHPTPSQAVNTA